MLQFYLIMYSLIMSILFMQMKHPLSMGITLLMQTVLVCLISGLFSKTFWYSYILFLIFVGGMLVLFIYVTSLASNEMFSMSVKSLFIFIIMFMFINMILMMTDNLLINNLLMNSDMNSIINNNNFIVENTISLNKLYNFPTNYMTLILINYLFLTLIIIVKITNNFFGPLRQMI
uniref:NADH-ubiquinone oxidoreductase chain 6 n=1 Tax=Paradelphomyia sp. ZK-2016 TaxID=1808011 RepID=A0A191F7P7_9DIPT|nr:NADH dehydrogenase subunit 6 [Paradelphomyia sp. ZK-2016]